MGRRAVSGVTLALLFMGLLTLPFSAQLVDVAKASDGALTTVGSCLVPVSRIYGDIITFVDDTDYRCFKYYNISTGTSKILAEITFGTKHGYINSIYNDFIVFPYGEWYGDIWKLWLRLDNISTGSGKGLPYGEPGQFDLFNEDDVWGWLDLIIYERGYPISMYGDIIALSYSEGIFAYNITAESIIANLTTRTGAVSVYGNVIAFSDNSSIWYYNLTSAQKISTTLTGTAPSMYGNVIAFQDDVAIKYYNISSGQLKTVAQGKSPSIYGDIIAFSTRENQVGLDLNDDGDKDDRVIRYYNISTNTLKSTRQVGGHPSIHDNTLIFHTKEQEVDADLNNDGDKEDLVVRFIRPFIREVTLPGDLDGDYDVDEDDLWIFCECFILYYSIHPPLLDRRCDLDDDWDIDEDDLWTLCACFIKYYTA